MCSWQLHVELETKSGILCLVLGFPVQDRLVMEVAVMIKELRPTMHRGLRLLGLLILEKAEVGDLTAVFSYLKGRCDDDQGRFFSVENCEMSERT